MKGIRVLATRLLRPSNQKSFFSTKVPVPAALLSSAQVTEPVYKEAYRKSIENPDTFWAEQARERLTWMRDFSNTSSVNTDIRQGPVSVKWFADGQLNVAVNCVDRHVESGRGSQTAIIWEGDDAEESRSISYAQLSEEVNRIANVLREQLGVKKGDRVSICMPMVPETAAAMLACARIGAVHSVIFGGFSPEAVMGRIVDCESKVILTADYGMRGGKQVPLKAIVDDALDMIDADKNPVEAVVVLSRGGNVSPGPLSDPERDVWWHEATSKASAECAAETMNAEDPLFVLYTSGSTGKPKGVLHTSAGDLLGASLSHETTFDHREGDIFWCTADCGWITGHTYSVYGPLANVSCLLSFLHGINRSLNTGLSCELGGDNSYVRRRAFLPNACSHLGNCRQIQGESVVHCANGTKSAHG